MPTQAYPMGPPPTPSLPPPPAMSYYFAGWQPQPMPPPHAQNQVQSTAMTDLELEVTGKGIVNDSTYRQNAVVRFLEKLLVF